MQSLLDAYYNERRKNETLEGNIKLLLAKLKRVKENYDYVVEMSQQYKDISEEEKQAELAEGKAAVHKVVNYKVVDYDYDTGHVIPGDKAARAWQDWG